MKINIYLIGIAFAILLLSGCQSTVKTDTSDTGSQATFGEGDIKFSVELIEGNYLATDNPRADLPDVRTKNDAFVRGSLKLKLCNKGQKELPFILTKDTGGIFIEFKPEDVQGVSPNYIAIVETIAINSDEGFINLVPNTCPTYSFSFDTGGMGVGEPPSLTKNAFQNAKYYFFIGDKKFPLNGKVDFAYKATTSKV